MNNNNQHILQGYKNSPLGIIPEDWEVKRLGCAFHLQGGFAFKSEEYKNSGIPIIRISNLPQNGKFVDISDCVYSDRQDIAQQFHLRCDDLLIAMSGATTGKVAIYNNNNIGYLNQRVGLFQHTSSLITYQYLYFLVISDMYSNQLTPLLIAGAQPNIAPSDIENLKFPVPPIPEQQRIVSVLQLWDTAIEKQTQLVEKLTLRKRGLMQQLLTGKKRLKGFEGEWEEVKLGEIGKFLTNNTLSREQLNTSEGEVHNIHYGDVLIKYASIINCDKTFLPYINRCAYKETKADFLKDGDIIIADTAEDETVGKACEVQNIFDKKILAGLHTILFRPNRNTFAPYFLGYYINSEKYHSKLLPLIQGIKVCSIGKQAIRETMIDVPPVEEQNAIASILIQADKEIDLAKQKLLQLQAQKRGLMQVLLTGKKRVK